MKGESAVQFPTRSRVHVGLEVRDLERSVDFYRLLFDAEPTKTRPGYARFEPAEPPVNLSLNERPAQRVARPSGALHHGVQVKTAGDVEAAAERFRRAGYSPRIEEETTCCYAVQTKAWVEDPDGNAWEIFVVLADDAPSRASETSSCCHEACCTE